MKICLAGVVGLAVLATTMSFVCNPGTISGPKLTSPPPFLEIETPWADSVLNTLSIKEKIGQLLMVGAYTTKGAKHEKELYTLINQYGIGGVIFFKGHPTDQVEMTNRLQDSTSVPLLVAMDAEWGPAMRLDSTVIYPREMTLGAIQNERLTYEYGREMGRQLKRLGVHVSFSPVVDINNNPANPVIGSRSFGENRDRVSKHGLAYMSGLQKENILANAKHFPGHGDTDTDSHHALPLIAHDRSRLDSLELYPFRSLINGGLGSVMIAHLEVPALDSTPSLPTTLSKKVVDQMLKKEFGFKGLVFTDAMNMQGVASQFKPGEAELKALLAGNDVLLMPEGISKAVSLIEKAIIDSLISMDEIDARCHKVLKVKEWTGASRRDTIPTQNLFEDLNNGKALATLQKSIERAITTVKNDAELIPINGFDSLTTAVVNMGDMSGNSFTKMLSKHMTFDSYSVPKEMNSTKRKEWVDKLKVYDRVIVNLLSTSHYPKNNYGVSAGSETFAIELQAEVPVILNVFASPYSLRKWANLDHLSAVTIAYQDDNPTQIAMAEYVVGALGSSGRLPVGISSTFPEGTGLDTKGGLRIKYANPEYLGYKSEQFLKIDSIALNGIAEKAYPGCRVMVIKDGVAILDKSYGHLTYERVDPVSPNTIYDLASITKIMASTPAMMYLSEKGRINMEYNLCDYMEMCDTSYYFNVNLKEMMSHTARLRSWIPFYVNTLKEGGLDMNLYRTKSSQGYSIEVAQGLYIKDSYTDSIFNTIDNTPLNQTRKYRYSDIGYYFIQRLVEDLTGQQLEDFSDSLLYKPLGLPTMGYHPLDKFEAKIIAPTEYDMVFRQDLIQGYVHDPGAAMMGGVGGHAGVFSNAHDLAVMMQMYLDGGSYGGKQYFDSETIDYFTRCHFCFEENRRGLGFDKPEPEPDSGPACNSASSASFGHSGFTGTVTWADPEHDLVYVFLSNRVYPNADNRKLVRMNIRTDIQQAIYDALELTQKDGLAQE